MKETIEVEVRAFKWPLKRQVYIEDTNGNAYNM